MDLAIIFEIICFCTALICLLKKPGFPWQLMVPYLFVTCVTEISGSLIRAAHHHNAWVYNIYLVFEAGFTSIIFGGLLSKYVNSRPLVLSGAALLLLLYILESVRHGFFVFNDITATVMSVIFVIYSLYYYFLLIRDQDYTDLKHYAPFWWVAGALFFYFGSTVCNLFYTFLNGVTIAGHNIDYFVFNTLNVILYSCWVYSFICKRWAAKI